MFVGDIKAKQPESRDLCGNITEFGVAEGDHSANPNEVILPYRSPDESCFVFISYCLMILYCDVIMLLHCSVTLFHCSVMRFMCFYCLEHSVVRES